MMPLDTKRLRSIDVSFRRVSWRFTCVRLAGIDPLYCGTESDMHPQSLMMLLLVDTRGSRSDHHTNAACVYRNAPSAGSCTSTEEAEASPVRTRRNAACRWTMELPSFHTRLVSKIHKGVIWSETLRLETILPSSATDYCMHQFLFPCLRPSSWRH